MGKIAKPQRSNKQKKIKAVDPFYHGSRKDRLTEGINQKPKNIEQEVPKKLKYLGFSIEGVRAGKVGKKSAIKFQHYPDGPCKYNTNFRQVLGAEPSTNISPKDVDKTPKHMPNESELSVTNNKVLYRKGKLKVTQEVFHNYIDNLGPARPYKDNFSFQKSQEESYSEFIKRVNDETNFALVKSKVEDKFDVSDERKMLMKAKATKGMNEKKKQRLKEKKQKKLEAFKEKKKDRKGDFAFLQDEVKFGEVAHAPPVLSVLPKKAKAVDNNRPGLRMPELKAAFEGSTTDNNVPRRKLGQTVKRKSLTPVQKILADAQRDLVIEAYRMSKKKKH